MQWLQEHVWFRIPNGFGLVLCALIGFVCVYGVLRRAISAGRHGSQIEIVESKSLGKRHHLVVIRYRQNRFLLGVSPHGIRFLCDLEKESNADSCIGNVHKNIDTPA